MELLEINYKEPQRNNNKFYGYPDVGRYRHWQWGEEYEELFRKYPTRPIITNPVGELIPLGDVVINPNPVIMYCLEPKQTVEG